MKTCTIDGCGRPHHSRGLCAAHRSRLQRTGKVNPDIPIGATDADRFWARVVKSGTCWEWTGARTVHGHGQFGSGNRVVYAHRFAYEHSVGAIPVDHVLHHTCENPACVKPAHLTAMTQSEHAAMHQRLRYC